MSAAPPPLHPSTQAQAERLVEAWVARNLEPEDGAERRRRAAEAARRLVQLALSLEPAVSGTAAPAPAPAAPEPPRHAA